MPVSQTATPASTPRASASQPSTPVAQVQSTPVDLAIGASALLANLNLHENQAGYSPVATPPAPRRDGPSNNPFAASAFSNTDFPHSDANALRFNVNTSPTQHTAAQSNPPANFLLNVPAVTVDPRRQPHTGVVPTGQGSIPNMPSILSLAAPHPTPPFGTTVYQTPMTSPQALTMATPNLTDNLLFDDATTPQHGSASTSHPSTPQTPPAYVVITPQKDKNSP